MFRLACTEYAEQVVTTLLRKRDASAEAKLLQITVVVVGENNMEVAEVVRIGK